MKYQKHLHCSSAECMRRRAEALKAQLEPGSYQSVSSQAIGLPLGVMALAVARKALPSGAPFQTGGGAARLVSPGWVIWASAPYKFEAGTPAIVNVIAFARALRLVQHFGNDVYHGTRSVRHGASPGRYGKRSSVRSSPSAPGCWVRLWQPLIFTSNTTEAINLAAESLRVEHGQADASEVKQ
jgi:hypothetical protein